MIVTYEMLDNNNACSGQSELYKQLFPDNLELTEKTMLEIVEKGVDYLKWLSKTVLTKEELESFYKLLETIRKEHIEIMEPIKRELSLENTEKNRNSYFEIKKIEDVRYNKTIASTLWSFIKEK
jgi:hypothetical protein